MQNKLRKTSTKNPSSLQINIDDLIVIFFLQRWGEGGMGSIEKGIKSKPQNVKEIISGWVCRCFLDGFSKISGVNVLLFKSTKKMHYGQLSDKSFIYCHGLFQICGTTSLSLGRYSLEKAMAPHSNTLTWKTPWMGAW